MKIRVAVKRIAAVERTRGRSNQHELNGVSQLRDFFPTDGEHHEDVLWHLFRDDRDPECDSGRITFYDARRRDPRRSEWRMYYTEEFIDKASVGDVLIFCRDKSMMLHGLLIEAGSSWARACEIVFGPLDDIRKTGQTIEAELPVDSAIEFCRLRLLELLGINLEPTSTEADAILVRNEFGDAFPSTRELSAFARQSVDADVCSDDDRLLRWLTREEQLFRALEKNILGTQIASGFADIDAFVDAAKSILNRRKSRMGRSLENHLEELFNSHHLRFTRNGKTEGRNTPDFLFPGVHEYHNASFDPTRLLMLGAKSTLKERWRQILAEADRVSVKHLCTLDTALTFAQAKEMRKHGIVLVIPKPLHEEVGVASEVNVLTIGQFIERVSESQQ